MAATASRSHESQTRGSGGHHLEHNNLVDENAQYESKIDLHGMTLSGTYCMLLESTCCSTLERFIFLKNDVVA